MTLAYSTKVDAKQNAALIKAFKQSPEIVADELTRATWEASLLMEREVKENTPVGIGGGGGLKGSIAAQEPEASKNGILGITGTPMAHAVPVELGTKPHMPPIQPLADWAQHKLGVSEKEARSVGFLIARKISKKGTEGAHMFERAFNDNESQVEQIYDRARKRIVKRMEEGAS